RVPATASTPGCNATSSGTRASPAPGRGSSATSSASGTSAHAMYATRAPNALRNGSRRSRTSAVAAVTARVPSSRQRRSSALIIDLPDQPPEFLDVLLAELAALTEVRDQRRDPATKQAVKHALTLRSEEHTSELQ